MISLRSAWNDCFHILHITERSAYIWDCVKKEMPREKVASMMIDRYDMTAKEAFDLYDSFIRSCIRMKYFLPEDET